MMSASVSRRRVLRAGVAVGLASLWPARARAEGEAFQFIQVNDLHFHDEACGPWFERVIAAIKASAPEAAFCLACGDLADGGKPGQLAGARAALDRLEMPIHAVPGNHDYFAADDRRAYDQHFPGQTNYHFAHAGWQLIGLDSCEGTKFQGTRISDRTLAWLDAELPKLDAAKPTIVFTHFPLGEGVTYRPQNAGELLSRFKDRNLQAVFGGHWHGFTARQHNAATLTTDRCCARVRGNHDGTKEKGWFVCEARDGKVTRRFVEIPAELLGGTPALP